MTHILKAPGRRPCPSCDGDPGTPCLTCGGTGTTFAHPLCPADGCGLTLSRLGWHVVAGTGDRPRLPLYVCGRGHSTAVEYVTAEEVV